MPIPKGSYILAIALAGFLACCTFSVAYAWTYYDDFEEDEKGSSVFELAAILQTRAILNIGSGIVVVPLATLQQLFLGGKEAVKIALREASRFDEIIRAIFSFWLTRWVWNFIVDTLSALGGLLEPIYTGFIRILLYAGITIFALALPIAPAIIIWDLFIKK